MDKLQVIQHQYNILAMSKLPNKNTGNRQFPSYSTPIQKMDNHQVTQTSIPDISSLQVIQDQYRK